MKLERICYWILIFALGIILFNLKYCSGRKPCPTITSQVIHDTVNRPDSAKTEHPVPVSVRKLVKKDNDWTFSIDSSWNLNIDSSNYTLIFDTIPDCSLVKDYSYKYEFPEGDIVVENSVQNNSLQNQKVFPLFRKVETTKYVTQTDTLYQTKSKAIFYLGAGLYGNKITPLRGGIFDASLKTKNDRIYSLGRFQSFVNEGYWFGEVKIPIKLKK